MRSVRRVSLVLLCLAAVPGGGLAVTAEPGWTGRQAFEGTAGAIHYYLFTPARLDPGKKYPMVLWLHGGLKSNGVGGPNLPTGAFYGDEQQEKHPCFVLRPVAIQGTNWVSPRGAGTASHAMPERPAPSMTVLLELLDRVLSEQPIDPKRVHVTGASMGGYGTWDIVTRHPEKFASAVPICGGGDPGKAARLKNMRIWIFHSADDRTVPVRGSREMFQALMTARGEMPKVRDEEDRIVSSSADGRIRYTEYKTGGHNAWDRAFREPGLMEWVFAGP